MDSEKRNRVSARVGGGGEGGTMCPHSWFLENKKPAWKRLKGELKDIKNGELLVFGHCIYFPLILFACASFGQSYNIGSPWHLIFVAFLE